MLNIVGQNPAEEVLQAMIDEVSAYWCGTIDFPVFMCISVRHLIFTAEFKAAFPVDDYAGITKEELGRLVMTMGQDLTDDDLEDMFDELIIDGSGTIPADEFYEVVSYPAQQSAMQIALANETTSSGSAQ